MRVKLFAIIILLLGLQPLSKADEGMWIPMFIESLNYQEMKEMGLKLTPDEIYSVNNSSLKDAIAIFGRGCTSELISDKGLLLTNHHCGYGRIQAHSSVEHDYLTEGFWAETLEDELPNPGLSATFLIRIEDVTEEILKDITFDMTEEERSKKIREIANALEDKATEGSHYNASVRSFFEGNEYYMFVYETFKDVRLVGAPPSSIGKYGADTDNWMWPRHTGDFSLFRVYTGKDGKPAEYSKENIPLKPRHYLPISMTGVKKEDFAMIMGYPGRTERYKTSYGIKMALDISNQTVVNVRDRKLKIMMEDMQADPEVRIKYASKYARTSNYWKYFIGQTKGLKRLKVYDKKQALEEKFTNWVKKSEEREKKYGNALELIKEAYETISKTEKANIYLREAITRGSEILGLAYDYEGLVTALENEAEQDKIDELVSELREQAKDHFKDYNAPTDRKLLAAMLEMYHKNIPMDQQPEHLKKIADKYKEDFDKFASKMFDKSYFVSMERVYELLENPSAKKIKKDPAFETVISFINFYNENIRHERAEAFDKLGRGNRLFIAGLREMNPDKNYYPDANFTMRLTYGQVLDYYPADAVHYDYFTTLEGVMEKEDPNNWEFVVHDKLKALYESKDYGPYGENGTMRVCFLTNHDITGGNSGSPVMNGKGELIGLAFDGNWEAMSGDIAFEPELQRTINVDIRYVLFIIDKFAGAQNLIDEMKLVYARPGMEKEMKEKTEPQPVEVEE